MDKAFGIFIIWFFCLPTLQAAEKISLCSQHEQIRWMFRESGAKDWNQATVPGTIHTDLQLNGRIPNPFYGCNEFEIQWIEERDWEYSLEFELPEQYLSYSNQQLVFEGLDTHSDVFLNDSLVLRADNMFRTWKIDVRNLLRQGKNQVRIVFHSPIRYVETEKNKLEYELPGGEWAYIRKAAYHFGWDWGPRFVTSGIFKPVYLYGWSDLNICDLFLYTSTLSEKKADLKGQVVLDADSEKSVRLRVKNLETESVVLDQPFQLETGRNPLDFSFSVKKPKLWWTHELGDPFLYPFQVEIIYENRLLDTIIHFGIRTIDVVNKPDQWGESFYFRLNGKPVFMKGANYIPQNSFVTLYGRKETEALLKQAVESNMNMLRVWGGGIYEDDQFYELCDRMGILIWQDFMFACSMVRGDEDFLENVREEATQQVKRLRNYASLALWCGNNEISEGWHNWGWQRQYSLNQSDSAVIWNNYLRLFQHMLKEVVDEFDPSRTYWPSSPQFGWGRPESMTHGDSHYWGVWWGYEPFSTYRKKTGRFMSEYGFQALPDPATLHKVIPEDSLTWDSRMLRCHQKHPRGMETIEAYLKYEQLSPCEFEDYVYFSQLIQAGGIKTAIEAHRVSMPRCMGTLYWQFNDCWPVISWSGIDHDGIWKALQYHVKNAYQNILPVIMPSVKGIRISLVSDRKIGAKGKIRVVLADFYGNIVIEMSKSVKLRSGFPLHVFNLQQNDLGIPPDSPDHLIYVEFQTENQSYENTYYFSPVGSLRIPPVSIRSSIKPIPAGYEIELRSDVLAKHVQPLMKSSSLRFSDAFFDLVPGISKTIRCETNLTQDEFEKEFYTKSMIDYCTN
jgi:beta-mannosidase